MSAFNIIKSDDGLSYRIEWDAHYITDEQVGVIREYIESIQEENERLRAENKHIGLIAYELGRNSLAQENKKLRELCLDLWASCPVHDEDCQTCNHYDGAFCDLYARMEELVKI